jgi:DNA repair protein RadC
MARESLLRVHALPALLSLARLAILPRFDDQRVATVIANLPMQDRPRERLWTRGVEALNERELLALVLRSGRCGESVLDLATALLGEYGSLAGLAAARPEELANRRGIGPTKAAALVAAFRLGRLATTSSARRPLLASSADVAAVTCGELGQLRRERVLVLVCNAANRLERTIAVSEGSVDRSLVPVREILNAVLRHDGRAFAIAHNHPSGDPTPSDADRRATEDIAAAARIVGLRFLDHVVVAGERWATAGPRRRC